jgi:hypothetical protein
MYGYGILTQYTFMEFPDFYLGGILIFSFFSIFGRFRVPPPTENRQNGVFLAQK